MAPSGAGVKKPPPSLAVLLPPANDKGATTPRRRHIVPTVLWHLLFLCKRITNLQTFPNMCKSEIFNRILNTVSQETEITIDEILSRSHRKEIVDARYLFVYFLRSRGFIPAEIARRLQLTPQAVSGIICKFQKRREQGDRIFEINYQQLCKQLKTD